MTAYSNVVPIRSRSMLAQQAMIAAIAARVEVGKDLYSPISVYDLCEAHGVTVRFNDIATLEGMYERGPRPRIHLSALRPLGRRAYNCAHELAHHVFGHATTVHELCEARDKSDYQDANEFLANVFAGFLLMPTLGVRRAFAARKCSPTTASPRDIFAIACEFGVGYSTLITHLLHTLRELAKARATELLRWTPKMLRADIIGAIPSEGLVLVDEHHAAGPIDTEVGTHVLLPTDTAAMNTALVKAEPIPGGMLYVATHPGIVRLSRKDPTWAAFLRISRRQYVGLARYRHLSESSDE